MGFSSAAIEQRQKEAQTRKSFLALSLIGSLALHVLVLAFGINNLLNRTPEVKEEPLEIAIVEPPPTPEPKKPEPEKSEPKQPQAKPEPARRATRSTAAPRRSAPTQPQTPTRTAPKPTPQVAPSPPPVVQKQPAPKPTEDLKPQPVQQPKPVTPPPPQPPVATQPTAPGRTSTQDVTKLRGALGSERTARESSAAPAQSSSANTANSGQSSAAAPTTNRQPAQSGGGDGDDNASCRDCKRQYSELARRQGKEGVVRVRVVTDADGKVISAEVVGSSGVDSLDRQALRNAKQSTFKNAKPGKPVVIRMSFKLD